MNPLRKFLDAMSRLGRAKPPFSEPVPKGVLGAEEVRGQRIDAVFQVYEWKGIDGWLDYSCTYLRLGNGHWIMFQSSNSEDFVSLEKPSAQAKTRPDSRLLGRTIVQVHRRFSEGEPDGESVVLELDNGIFAEETPVAPHGTGGAGVYFLGKLEGEWELFWK
jgi:hypothetical protein